MSRLSIIKKAVTNGLDMIKNGVGNPITQEIKTTLATDFSGVTSIVNAIAAAVDGVADDALDKVSTWIESNMATILEASFTGVTTYIANNIVSLLAGSFSSIVNSIKAAITSIDLSKFSLSGGISGWQ